MFLLCGLIGSVIWDIHFCFILQAMSHVSSEWLTNPLHFCVSL